MTNRLFLIRSTEPGTVPGFPYRFPDMLYVAESAAQAMQMWTEHFAHSHKPTGVMVHQLPDPAKLSVGLVEWSITPMMRYEVHTKS